MTAQFIFQVGPRHTFSLSAESHDEAIADAAQYADGTDFQFIISREWPNNLGGCKITPDTRSLEERKRARRIEKREYRKRMQEVRSHLRMTPSKYE